MTRALDRALLTASRARPSLEVALELAAREAHAGDESGLAPVVPGAVVQARSREDVAALLAAASAEGVPVTPRAAATGKAGGAIPDEDGIALVLTGLAPELELDRGDRVAVVSASTVTARLREAAEREGLFYGPDPSSLESSTLGGNVATNASGPSSLLHGDTARWVLGLDVVTASGALLSMPSRTSKSTVGYDLAALFTGSEGTLGVVTRAYLRLLPAPERVLTATVLLPSLAAIGDALVSLDAARLRPRAIELLDDEALATLRSEGRGEGLDPRAVALLLVELEGDELGVERDLERLAHAVLPHALDVRLARNEREREELWRVRRDTSYALKRSARHKLSEDVVVPRSRIAALIARSREIAGETGIRMPSYGHAGDGNLHVNFLWDDDEIGARVEGAMARLFAEVVALGGTLSGEHGLGRAKARYLPLAHEPARIEAQRRIKALFDPAGILNPRKVLPPPGA
jgi:glycolate oxidase